MSPKKTQLEESGVADAASTAYSEVEQLAEELQSWYDNMPESLQNGDKASALQDAIGTLEGVAEVDIPDCAAGLTCQYLPLKRKASRATRCSYATEILNAVSGALRERIEVLNDMKFDEVEDEQTGDVKEEGDDTASDEPGTESERDDHVSALESAADEIENHASELEGVEFPGMMG